MKIQEYVFSHRGASGEELEHTFKAYDLAIEYGSKYIEQDLVTSKDGTLYVSHDLSAKKLTGVDRLFSDMSDLEIDDLRTEEETSILTFQEVINRYGKKISYVVELKENGKQVPYLEEILVDNDISDNIIIQAKESFALSELENSFPEIPKLLLVTEQTEIIQHINDDFIDIISVNKSLMNEANVQLVQENHKLFNVWTLNSYDEILEAINLGVDSYFTDYTAKSLLLEKKYR
jgi:glycerophosphoryl diester phosphodiesterase